MNILLGLAPFAIFFAEGQREPKLSRSPGPILKHLHHVRIRRLVRRNATKINHNHRIKGEVRANLVIDRVRPIFDH